MDVKLLVLVFAAMLALSGCTSILDTLNGGKISPDKAPATTPSGTGATGGAPNISANATQNATIVNSTGQVQAAPAVGAATDEAGDCSILSADELSSICGNTMPSRNTVIVPGEICRTTFAQEGGTATFTISYLQVPKFSNPQYAINVCMQYNADAQNVSGGCLYDNSTTLVFPGIRYDIKLWNNKRNDRLCSEDQMKAIAGMLKKKLGA